jgi:LPXTG-motif cell wall-anchored protein
MKKAISALVLAGTITLAGAVPAMAAVPQYPGTSSECAVVLNGTQVAGVGFNFFGSASAGCFVPGATITITITLNGSPQASGGGLAGGPGASVPSRIIAPLAPQTLTATADASGNYSVPVTINEPGEYTVTASGAGGSYSTVITVGSAALSNTGAAPLANSGAGLANTGADSGLILWTLVGAGALAAGATSVVVVRRRAKSEAAA